MSERLLRFPADENVGDYWAFRGETCVASGPALGTVRVPEGSDVVLHPWPHVRGLYELPPDALYKIRIRKGHGSDDDLRHLAHLTGLRELRCSKAVPVTDAGIAHIAALRELRDLDLYRTSITDRALAVIGRLHQLTHLHLGMTKVKGPGVVHLLGLQRLFRLSLECTAVGDGVVPILARMTSLRRLVLWETRITVDGLAHLRAALPLCSVELPDPKPSYMAPDKVQAILLGRIQAALRELGRDGLDRERLLDCAITEWREPEGAIVPVGPSRWPAKEALLALARFRMGIDLHVVGPDVDVWVPWLRGGGRKRRKIAPKIATER